MGVRSLDGIYMVTNDLFKVTLGKLSSATIIINQR